MKTLATTGKNSCRQPAEVVDADHPDSPMADSTAIREGHAMARAMVVSLSILIDDRHRNFRDDPV
jgi:hypothetical protein